MTESQLIFTLISPNELKDDVIDCLMNFDGISGFNLTAINGFSKAHSNYNVEEQVQGYRQLTQFDIIIDVNDKLRLIEAISKVVGDNKLKYWVVKLSETSHLGEKI